MRDKNNTRPRVLRVCANLVLLLLAPAGLDAAEPDANLTQALTLYASFDDGPDADLARGDSRIYTSPDLNRSQVMPGFPSDGSISLDSAGRWGSCLLVKRKTDQVVFYTGQRNVAYQPTRLEGTVSLWMRLDPERDLAPGYVDPLQITDKSWNNACLFLDFTKDDRPRHFRLGVFSDYEFWNPQDRPWESVPAAERPMVDVAAPPFQADRWTHVAVTYGGFNQPSPGEAILYLNGQAQPPLRGAQRFSWQPEKVVVLLGIYYTGRIDDLAIFDRPLSADEIRSLASSQNSMRAGLDR